MSTTNRQRRATKARERQQQARRNSARERPRQAAGSPPAFDWSPPPDLDAQADRVVDALISAARLRRWIGIDRVLDVADEVLDRAEQRLRDQVESTVRAMFEHGWLPLDLVHVLRRDKADLVPLIARILVDHPAVASVSEPPAPWPEHLRSVAGHAERPLPEERNILLDLPVLLIRLRELPGLQRIAPIPSQWGRAPRVRAAVPDSADRTRLLDKIRALLAKAESTQFAAEAEAFTAKAQDLMTRHAIDAAFLQADSDDAVEVFARRVHLQGPYLREKNSLLAAVGRANRARVVFHQDLAFSTVVGTPIDVDQVEMLFTSLLIQATRAMTEAGAGRSGSFDRSRAFRQSFLTAYAVRIGERLTEADDAVTESYGSALVPVLRRQEEAVEAEFQLMFPNITTVRAGQLNRRGWEAGRAAAERATLVSGRISA